MSTDTPSKGQAETSIRLTDPTAGGPTPTPEERLGFDLRRTPLLVGWEIGAGVLGLIAMGFVLWYIASVLLIFFAAIFLGVFFSGIGKFLEKKTRFSYEACVAFTLLGLLQLVILTILLVGPSISSQFTHLSEALPKSYQQRLAGSRVLPLAAAPS